MIHRAFKVYRIGVARSAVEGIMADRKQFLIGDERADAELLALLDASRNTSVSEEDLREQRISFAFGNALNSEFITKESVRLASKKIRLLA